MKALETKCITPLKTVEAEIQRIRGFECLDQVNTTYERLEVTSDIRQIKLRYFLFVTYSFSALDGDTD